MPSFVSRLEESIFAAAWLRACNVYDTSTELGRQFALENAERVVQQFREAEREAAKRSMSSNPVKFAPGPASWERHHVPPGPANFKPVVAEPAWMNDETQMNRKVPSE